MCSISQSAEYKYVEMLFSCNIHFYWIIVNMSLPFVSVFQDVAPLLTAPEGLRRIF